MLTYTMGGPSIDAGAPCGDPRILRYTPPVPEFEVPITATARRLWPPLACERPAGVGRRCLATQCGVCTRVAWLSLALLARWGESVEPYRSALFAPAPPTRSSWRPSALGRSSPCRVSPSLPFSSWCVLAAAPQASSRPAAGQQGCRHVAVGCEVAPSLTAPGSICTRWRGRETRSRRAGRRPSLCGPGGATTCQRVPTRSRCVCMPRRRVH